MIIDAHVHVFERNHAGRPWTGAGSPLTEADGAQTMELMNENGVDGAIIVSPWLNYLTDASYAFETARRYPGRFGVVAPLDTERERPVDVVEQVRDHPFGVGLRMTLWNPADSDRVQSGALDPVFEEMALAGLPLCLALGSGTVEPTIIARSHPDLAVIIDHLGLPASHRPPASEAPFGRLPDVLALAALPNVHIKLSGMPALSHDPSPYVDLREPLRRLIDRFGAQRLMWGTDWTRTHAFLDYRSGVEWIKHAGLSAEELEAVTGANAARVFGLSFVRER